jgi:predicted PhzF superfamily epimerase YddE/YHI9
MTRFCARSLPKITSLLELLHPFVVAVTAREETVDFVTRYFKPSYSIPEDPVTGSPIAR